MSIHLELFISGRRSAKVFTPRRSLETSRTDFSNRNRYAICEALSSTSHRPLYIDQQRPSVLPWAPVPSSLALIDVRSAPVRIDLQADKVSCDCLRDRHSKWLLVCTLPSPLRRRSRHESIHISRHASRFRTLYEHQVLECKLLGKSATSQCYRPAAVRLTIGLSNLSRSHGAMCLLSFGTQVDGA